VLPLVPADQAIDVVECATLAQYDDVVEERRAAEYLVFVFTEAVSRARNPFGASLRTSPRTWYRTRRLTT
jgi:hypothetical protein